MKFTMNLLPSIPATLEERRALRPIAARTDRFQMMLDQYVELAKMAEDLGFDMVTSTEHHLHEEGLEMGNTPALHATIAAHTSHVKVGPIGYVLPAWNPLRLAIETSWLDQLTKGRSVVGMARGYQTRWVNQLAQHIHVGPSSHDSEEADKVNREVFEEVWEFLKLAWADEPFEFNGKYYQYPYPIESGTPWKATNWSEDFGSPGVVEDGFIKKINVVPKPYRKPRPLCFSAFSSSDATIKWAAREGIYASVNGMAPTKSQTIAETYRASAVEAGHDVKLGERINLAHLIVFGDDEQDAFQRALKGTAGTYYKRFAGEFGFWEAFKVPSDEGKFDGQKLPSSEWTMERLAEAGHLIAGTPADVRRKIDRLVEGINPEYLQFGPNQGLWSIEESKRQLRIFGEKIMPHYLDA
ncbi:MAG: LLM class flavin-dependent oxidoreductase [Mycetocola sp.]